LPFANSRRIWVWACLLGIGWAAMLVELVTLEWVPDCGGISYGLPLPYLTTFTPGSMEFDWFLAPWLVNVLLYTLVLSIPAWLLARCLSRMPRWARNLTLTFGLAPWFSLLLLAQLLAIGAFHWQLEASVPLKVHEWHSVRPYLGSPDWGSHQDSVCN
jgi:hypothetical protein